MKPWTDVIPSEEIEIYNTAGFGGPSGIGENPGLVIIDIQYRTVGTTPKPILEAMKEFPTSCGDIGWRAVENVKKLLNLFREKGWPTFYPHVAPKKSYDAGRLAEKIPAIMNVAAKGYDFVEEIAPAENDIRIPKRHPSAFYGTSFASYLIDNRVDTLIVTGCTTSGCVRATVVDAFSYNFKIALPHDAVYDRSLTSHKVNLFDMETKYADVMSTSELLEKLKAL